MIAGTDAARRLHAAERQDSNARVVDAHTAAVNLLKEFERRGERTHQVQITFPDFDYETVKIAADMEIDRKIGNAEYWLRTLHNLGADKDTVKQVILLKSREDITDADAKEWTLENIIKWVLQHIITMRDIQKLRVSHSSSLFILTFSNGSKVTIEESGNEYKIIPELYTNIKNLGIRRTQKDSKDKLVERIFLKLETKGLLPQGIETWEGLKKKLYIVDWSVRTPLRWNGSWRIGVSCEPPTHAQHNAIQQYMHTGPSTYRKELSEMYTLLDPNDHKWLTKSYLVV